MKPEKKKKKKKDIHNKSPHILQPISNKVTMKHKNKSRQCSIKKFARLHNRTKKSQPISRAKENSKSLADRCKKFIYNYSDYNITPIRIVRY